MSARPSRWSCRSEQVEIWLRGTRIASHARCHEPHALVRDPAHFEGLFRRRWPPRTDPAPSAPAANPVCRPLSIYTEMVEGGRP